MIPPEVVLVPLIAAAACALPIGALARPLAALAALIVAGIAGASAWLGLPGGPDGFGSTILVLIGVLFAAGAVASGGIPGPRGYFALWSLLLAAIASAVVATDLVAFFASWESMLVPLALLLWLWGGADRRRAALRLALMWLAGSALLLTGVVALGVGARTFVLADLAGRRLAEGSQLALALLFLAAFAVRLPLFPLHAWLGPACRTAPAPVAILLCGATPAVAIYAIARLCVPFFPVAMADLAPYLVALSAVGALYAALLASRQRDTRTFIAYASLSQVQLVAAGAFAATPTGAAGALLAAVFHGLAIGALVAVVAALARRAGTFTLGPRGVAGRAPVLTSLAVVAMLIAIGSPGDILVLAAVFAVSPGVGLVASLGLIASAAYAGVFLRTVFTGAGDAPGTDIGWRERGPALALLGLALVLSVAPKVVTDLADRPAAVTRSMR